MGSKPPAECMTFPFPLVVKSAAEPKRGGWAEERRLSRAELRSTSVPLLPGQAHTRLSNLPSQHARNRLTNAPLAASDDSANYPPILHEITAVTSLVSSLLYKRELAGAKPLCFPLLYGFQSKAPVVAACHRCTAQIRIAPPWPVSLTTLAWPCSLSLSLQTGAQVNHEAIQKMGSYHPNVAN